MTYKSEAAVMKVLGVSSWEVLTDDQVERFARLMTQIDPGVLRGIVEQLPHFASVLPKMLDGLDRSIQSGFSHNQKNVENFHEALRETRAIVQAELSRGDLEPSRRTHLTEVFMELLRMQAQKDTENKHFILRVLRICAVVAFAIAQVVVIVTLVVVFVASGGKVRIPTLRSPIRLAT